MDTDMVGCDGIRVWRGYKSSKYIHNHEMFLEKLRKIFIPITAQLLYPLGLKAYFPAIIKSDDSNIPDEVALVVYSSAHDYSTVSKSTTVGRAYGMMHGPLFNFSKNQQYPISKSSFPRIWCGEFSEGNPFYLLDNKVDWHSGKVRVSLLSITDSSVLDDFVKQINGLKEGYTESSPINNAIFVVEYGYILCWEHLKKVSSESIINPLIHSASDRIFSEYSQTVYAEKLFTVPDEGVFVSDNIALDVRI